MAVGKRRPQLFAVKIGRGLRIVRGKFDLFQKQIPERAEKMMVRLKFAALERADRRAETKRF